MRWWSLIVGIWHCYYSIPNLSSFSLSIHLNTSSLKIFQAIYIFFFFLLILLPFLKLFFHIHSNLKLHKKTCIHSKNFHWRMYVWISPFICMYVWIVKTFIVRCNLASMSYHIRNWMWLLLSIGIYWHIYGFVLLQVARIVGSCIIF